MNVEESVGRMLREKKLTLAVAESCTGGLVASLITDVPGSSDYFLGGVVSYSNAAKSRLLGVDEALLRSVGAVSEGVARAMAEGVRGLFDAGVGIATTGVLGPGGATPNKPVGLVYVAVAGVGATRVERYLWAGGRAENKSASAGAVLGLLATCLQGA